MAHSGSGSGSGSVPDPAHSPSFNEYSSGTMAETAARIVSEFPPDDPFYYHDNNDVGFYSQNDAFPVPQNQNDAFPEPQNNVVEFDTKPENLEEEEEDDDDSSFEFPVPGRGDDFNYPAAADEIFTNGQIRPLFPLFNTDLLIADTDWRDDFDFRGRNCDSKLPDSVSIRMPLKKLMISERETSVTESGSCSSSEADELEGVAPDTYCVWNPAKDDMRKKSKSTGSSKRWRIRDLLYRSNSDGGDGFVLLNSKQQQFRKKSPATAEKTSTEKYARSKVAGESDRKRSNSPYKQDPVGFFARMNGLSRTIQPF